MGLITTWCSGVAFGLVLVTVISPREADTRVLLVALILQVISAALSWLVG